LESLPDGDITEDIVKVDDTLYSKKAVAAYGWRYAPRDETTWDDVTEVNNLKSKGVEFLEGDSSKIPTTINVTAVDLNCTDAQIRSFRIYKKIRVHAPAHGIDDNFDLTSLDIDLVNPQNTKITVGKTVRTMTEYQSKQQTTIKNTLGGYVTQEQANTNYASKQALKNVEDNLVLEVKEEDEHKHSELRHDVDKIIFNAGQIEINSDNFALTPEGRIEAQSGLVGGYEMIDDGLSSEYQDANYGECKIKMQNKANPRLLLSNKNGNNASYLTAETLNMFSTNAGEFDGSHPWCMLYVLDAGGDIDHGFQLYLDKADNTVKFKTITPN
jgi:hypothetical protein